MTKDELQKVLDWANAKVATGDDPPWAWYQYMKLKEAAETILKGMDATVAVSLPADLQQAALRRGSGHLRLVGSDQQESARPDQDTVEVPLPM